MSADTVGARFVVRIDSQIKLVSPVGMALWVPSRSITATKPPSSIGLFQSLILIDELDGKSYIARVISLDLEKECVQLRIYSVRTS